MKKRSIYLIMTFLLLSTISIQSKASSPASINPSQSVVSAEAQQVLARIQEIKKMDKSKLSSAEKKSLRKEAHILKIKAKNGNGGIYISVGALLIVIILLILLL
jgi:Skp family chaperone for outer membrane proteins